MWCVPALRVPSRSLSFVVLSSVERVVPTASRLERGNLASYHQWTGVLKLASSSAASTPSRRLSHAVAAEGLSPIARPMADPEGKKVVDIKVRPRLSSLKPCRSARTRRNA